MMGVLGLPPFIISRTSQNYCKMLKRHKAQSKTNKQNMISWCVSSSNIQITSNKLSVPFSVINWSAKDDTVFKKSLECQLIIS